MSKKSNTPPADADAQEEQQARRLYWRRVRHRLTGAAATVLLVGVLWYLGGASTPPDVSPAAVPTESLPMVEESPELLAAGQRLGQVDDFPEADLPPDDAAADEYPAEESAADESLAGESAADESPLADSAPATAEVPAVESAFVVQIGAFRERRLAQEAKAKLHDSGFSAHVKTIELQGVPWFKVRVSGYEQRPAAAQARQRLLSLGYKDAFIDDTR